MPRNVDSVLDVFENETTGDTIINRDSDFTGNSNDDVVTSDFQNINNNNINCNNVNNLQNNSSFLENYQKLNYNDSQNNQIIRREKLFNQFLENYTNEYKSKSEQKRKLKDIFFVVILSILGIIVVGSMILLIVLLNLKLNISNIIITLISTSAEIITSLLILPKIIAEYLFDKEEEQHLNEIIGKMQEYNLNSKNIKSNNTDENS